jgi:hypothetical protein
MPAWGRAWPRTRVGLPFAAFVEASTTPIEGIGPRDLPVAGTIRTVMLGLTFMGGRAHR